MLLIAIHKHQVDSILQYEYVRDGQVYGIQVYSTLYSQQIVVTSYNFTVH